MCELKIIRKDLCDFRENNTERWTILTVQVIFHYANTVSRFTCSEKWRYLIWKLIVPWASKTKGQWVQNLLYIILFLSALVQYLKKNTHFTFYPIFFSFLKVDYFACFLVSRNFKCHGLLLQKVTVLVNSRMSQSLYVCNWYNTLEIVNLNYFYMAFILVMYHIYKVGNISAT